MIRNSFSCLLAIVLLMMMAPQRLLSQSPAEAVFKTKCQVCHSADGSGDTVMGKKLGAKDLKSAEVQKQSDAEITDVIKKGKDKMKGFEGKLTDDEIKALVAYVRDLSKKK